MRRLFCVVLLAAFLHHAFGCTRQRTIPVGFPGPEEKAAGDDAEQGWSIVGCTTAVVRAWDS